MEENKKKKKRVLYVTVVVVVFIIAISLIGIGVYFNMISSNNYIMGTTIDKVNGLLKNYLENNGHKLRENYTIHSKIDVNLDSEKYRNESLFDIESLKKVNYLNNLSSMNTEIVLKKDTKNKKLYYELNEKILEENIVNYKYLIDNSTEYYFLDNFLNNYVNNGGCNYFESLDAENTTNDNFYYLYDFLINSLKKNLKDEYFSRYEAYENINGKNEKVKQISLKLTDDIVRKIAKNMLSDLKNDEKSKKILTSIDEDFSKWKIKDKTDFLKKDESYTINIYTTSFTCEFLKLEIVHLDGDDKRVITYDGDENKGELYYIVNDEIKYDVYLEFKTNKYEFQIRDGANNKIGEMKLEFDKKRTNLSFNFDDGKKKTDIIYTSKYLKNSQNDTSMTFKFLEDRVNMLSGNVHVVTEISDSVKIDEDVSNAILKATLTDVNKQSLETRRETIKARLER